MLRNFFTLVTPQNTNSKIVFYLYVLLRLNVVKYRSKSVAKNTYILVADVNFHVIDVFWISVNSVSILIDYV